MSINLRYRSVCITGTLALMTREDAVSEITKAGGYFDKSVSSKTDYLVVADKAGATKVTRAKAYGVKTLTEKQFLEALNPDKKPQTQLPQQPEKPKTTQEVKLPVNNFFIESRDW